ncbi:MAG: hypothetical protein QM742_16990 [Aquabacterium sp.]
MTSTRTEMTAFALGLFVGAYRSVIWVLMIRVLGGTLHFVMGVHAMVRMNYGCSEPVRLTLLWASHGCSYRPPEREQHANQQQDEDTESFHVEKLSRGA